MKLTIALLTLLSSSLLSLGQESLPKPTTKPQEHKGWVNLLEKGDKTQPLKHWRNVNVAPSTFSFIKDPKDLDTTILRCTGKPTGLIRSAEVYENFLVEFEWRHMELDGMRANAGFFIWSDALPAVATPFSRSIEIQVANFEREADWFTRHGDVFAIHGSKMTPDPRFASKKGSQRTMPLEFRAKGTAEWNHYRILCINGVIQLEVNGKVVSGGYHANPRKGHLMIESEGGEIHFRNMRILPLPSSENLKPDNIAKTMPANKEIISLYNGVNLEGWNSQGLPAKPNVDAQLQDCNLIPLKQFLTSKRIINPDKYMLMVDWYSPKDLDACPVNIGRVSVNMKPKKGKHRLLVDLKTLKASLDGKEIRNKFDGVNTYISLMPLPPKGYFSNILLIEK